MVSNGGFLLTVGGGGLLHSLGDQGENFIVVVAFGNIIESTVLDGLHAVGDITVGGQQDDFGMGAQLL